MTPSTQVPGSIVAFQGKVTMVGKDRALGVVHPNLPFFTEKSWFTGSSEQEAGQDPVGVPAHSPGLTRLTGSPPRRLHEALEPKS